MLPGEKHPLARSTKPHRPVGCSGRARTESYRWEDRTHIAYKSINVLAIRNSLLQGAVMEPHAVNRAGETIPLGGPGRFRVLPPFMVSL